MYDCQNDSCRDFAYDAGHTDSTTQSALKGTLVASAPHANHLATLEQLSQFARQRGYPLRQQEHRLELADVTLPDALVINARFGSALVISCDLRCHPPARFA